MAAATETVDELRHRAPASAVIAETLRAQASAPPRSPVARFFGRSPLSIDSRSWYLGALGELEVARVLDHLGAGWSSIHAIPVGKAGSDIDHLVIGPGGVYTINSKFHEGMKVWVGSKRLLVNGQRTDHLRNAAYEASRVAKRLTAAARKPVDVTPIVAIVAARNITVRERPTDVVVLSSSRLAHWLQRRPVALTSDDASQLTSLASDEATWGHPALPSADLVSFAVLRESVTSATRRRRTWALVILLSPVAVIAATFVGFFR
jgi:hypothetical protein